MNLNQLNMEFDRWSYPKDKIIDMLETRDEEGNIAIIWQRDLIHILETMQELYNSIKRIEEYAEDTNDEDLRWWIDKDSLDKADYWLMTSDFYCKSL